MLDVLEQRFVRVRGSTDGSLGQASIFDLGDDGRRAAPTPPPGDPRGEYEKAELLRLEKETLGLYVSEHPLSAVRDQLRRKTDCTLSDLERRREGEIVTIGEIVASQRTMTTKKGTRWHSSSSRT